jgi:phage terminase large subunit GpA-like protein
MNGVVEYSPAVVETWRRVGARWAAPPRLTVSQFADRELIVTSGPLAGTRWRTDYAPYQRGIMDAFHEPGVEYVVVRSSAQVGKTSLALALVAYHVAHDPCPILVVEPTVTPMAEDFSRNRLDPLISASPILRHLFAAKRKKDSSNTMLLKTFRGGALAIAGANSAASLAARSVRLLILDEVDRYPLELPGEGATLQVAMKRTAAFRGRRRIGLFSTPTLVGAPIDAWYRRGDQREYRVPCPACAEPFAFAWRQVRWKEQQPRTARLHCPACDHGLDDAERVASLAAGTWVPTHPDADAGVVSFHLWEAMSPFSALPDIVAAFLRARSAQKSGDPSEMYAWENTTLGEPREPDEGHGVEPTGLLARREPYASAVPAGACCLTMGVDVQDDRLELVVVGWGPGEECWYVDRRTLPGDTSQPEPWAALDAQLERRYTHTSGLLIGIEATFIDSGGHRTTTVYDYAARHAARRVCACIGRDGQRPIVSSPSPRRWGRGQRQVPLYTVGTDAAKALVFARLAVVPEPGESTRGVVHFPQADWIDDEFVAQLTSERRVRVFVKGIPREVYKQIRAQNETLDCTVYALAALRWLRPDLDAVAAKLTAPQTSTPPSPPTPARWIPQRQGWLTGRRR